MGAGVAKAIYTKWPRVKEQYTRFCKQYKPVSLLSAVLYVRADDKADDKIIVNCFSQLNYRRKNDTEDTVYTNYAAFSDCMRKIENVLKGTPIAMPYGIGCGLAGGDWDIIYNILCHVFGNEDHMVTLYKK